MKNTNLKAGAIVLFIVTLQFFLFSRKFISFYASLKSCTIRIDKSEMRHADLIKTAEDTALLLNNSSKYTWTGNNFIPPNGVPTFTPANYRNYFVKRNTLFIGDSTFRRAYATLFAMMTSCNDDDNNLKVKDLDSSTVIDFNKATKRSRKEVCDNPLRIFHDQNYFVCRDLLNATSWPLCPKNHIQVNKTVLDVHATKNIIKDQFGRFDFIQKNCLASVHDFFAEHGAFMNDYDLIIVGSGIWESLRPRDCKLNIQHFNKELNVTSTFTLSQEMKIDVLLDILAVTSSPKLQIVLRIPGFDLKNENDEVMLNIGHRMRNFIRNLNSSSPFSSSSYEFYQNKTKLPMNSLKPYSNYNSYSWQKISANTNFNVTFVDWQSVIAKRSFAEDRIRGDINPHYGLDARLLFAQQLLHHLRRLEVIKHLQSFR